MAKKLIIADAQREYIARLRNYIQREYVDFYDIEVFYDKNTLLEYISEQKCDVLLVSPELYDVQLNLKNVKLPIILQKDQEIVPSSEKLKWVIQKYTRISVLVKYIEEQFEEAERNRPLVYSIYSPAGGVGQTTVALGVALSYAQQGKKVLYMNFEEINSTEMFFERPGNMPEDILLKVGQDQDGQFLADYIKQDSVTKLMYTKRDDIDGNMELYESIGHMIEKVIDCGIANIVVMDLGHKYEMRQIRLMEQSDYVLFVDDTRAHSRFKISQILKQTQGELLLSGKVKRVLNQGKELGDQLPIEVVGKIEKIYSSTPIGVCEIIAKNKLLKLHGLV